MMVSLKTLGAAVLVATGANCAATGEESKSLQAWIDVEEQDGKLELRSMASATAPAELTYKLTVERTSNAGSSRTSQGGSVRADAEEQVVLSRSSVNALGDGTLVARLEVNDSLGGSAIDVVELGSKN